MNANIYSIIKDIEKARTDIAKLVGADKDEIVFTSGATESNNLAIKGMISKIKRGKKERQMEMIKMYREILKSPKFIEKLNEEILTNSDNKRLWINFTNEKSFDIEFVNMNHSKLINNIHKALNKWENYGYMYFIGKGEVLSKNRY